MPVIAMFAKKYIYHRNACVYCTDVESFVRVLTYQQRQNFALVFVIRRHRDVPALLPAKGDTAAVRTSDRRSQSKNFPDIRKSVGRKSEGGRGGGLVRKKRII